ncbi:MAG: hypothetical protein ABW249_09570 [Solirubrobacterales bacterium]|jgi:hypothetical protein
MEERPGISRRELLRAGAGAAGLALAPSIFGCGGGESPRATDEVARAIL